MNHLGNLEERNNMEEEWLRDKDWPLGTFIITCNTLKYAIGSLWFLPLLFFKYACLLKSVLNFKVYKQKEISNLEPTWVSLSVSDQSKWKPAGFVSKKPLVSTLFKNPLNLNRLNFISKLEHSLVLKDCILFLYLSPLKMVFCGGSDGKEATCNSGDLGSILVSVRSPGEGNGYPLQYSCLENSMDRRAWWATVHGIAKRETKLSD